MTKTDDFWVFGYGSLMWRPGFPFLDQHRAVAHGYHRQACVFSITYRGTPEQPGLVVGLAPGGSCRGIAFRVAEKDRADVIGYLDERELVTDVYVPKTLSVTLDDGRKVAARGYVADPHHKQYAGHLPLAEKAAVVRRGTGREGRSRDYIANVVTHLDEFGINDGPMHALLKLADDGD